MSNVLYARVSTSGQKIERQFEEIVKKYGPMDIVFQDVGTGSNLNRSEFQNMMNYLRDGDILHVESFSRISRSIGDFSTVMNVLKKKNVILKSTREDIDTSSVVGSCLCTIVVAMAELERDLILERQRLGIERAKREKKYKGRAIIKKPSNYKECMKKYLEQTKSSPYRLKQLQADLGGVKQSTLCTWIRVEKQQVLKEITV